MSVLTVRDAADRVTQNFDGRLGQVLILIRRTRLAEVPLDLVGRHGQLVLAGLDQELLALLAQAGPEGVDHQLH